MPIVYLSRLITVIEYFGKLLYDQVAISSIISERKFANVKQQTEYY